MNISIIIESPYNHIMWKELNPYLFSHVQLKPMSDYVIFLYRKVCYILKATQMLKLRNLQLFHVSFCHS